MDHDHYSVVLEKARTALSQKKIPDAPVDFKEVNVSEIQVKVFRFITKATKKIMRRLGL